MNVDGDKEDPQGLNHQMPERQEEKQHEEDNMNGTTEGVRAVSGLSSLQIPQQQVCWERFLHVRCIRVLLVENDDCTRHVVTALLRNCSYEVVEAANGIQALKILEDLNNHIDIVLTEVVMPYLSGIGLLTKILNHRTRSNIPVIMMSSHDSMGLVFKCLSKGAVDFLVKPIRKNELKNLWQHVWRRCHSSSGSGSGSESGTQTQKSVKSKSVDKSEKGSRSNDENENGSTGLNIGDGWSDDASDTQSSWTKQAVEVDSPQTASPWDRADSTCAQVIHSNAEASINELAAERLAEMEPQQRDGKFEDAETNVRITDNTRRNDNDKDVIESLDLNSDSPSKSSKFEGNYKASEASKTYCKGLNNEAVAKNSQEAMNIEHSSKRHRVKDLEMGVKDDRNVLRRSESSAFSRYHNNNPASNANGTPNHYSNVGSCNIEMSSTAENVFTKPATPKLDAAASSSAKPSPSPLTLTAHLVSNQKVPHSGSSNAYSVNGSVSGSNHGSSSAANVGGGGGLNTESDNNGAGKCGSGSGSGNRTDENKLSHRQAALTKFRQKRRDRCFRKKVRYQSRKKLAEQRPRVRGQFVRKKQGSQDDC